MKESVEQLATHCLEAVSPEFARSVRPGDIFVAGENLGIGSSREQAAQVLRHLGIRVVLARSVARIFYRNAINLGLPVLICPNLAAIEPGHELRVELVTGVVEDLTDGCLHHGEPIPPHLLEMLEDGGLLPHLERKLRSRQP
jgi:3-isopropylmalate/(R)-2-methylmalate dehydratase small subunit